MKINISILEKLGQTQSIHQADSIAQMIHASNIDQLAFKKLKAQSKDLVCILLPDDDDDSEE